MKMLKKTLSLTLAAALCLVLAAGCTQTAKSTFTTGNPFEAELLSGGTLLIGTSADYPPYESLNNQGQVEGFDIDMMMEVGKYMAEGGNPIKVEFKNMEFDVIITALQTGQIDLGVSAFTYSPDRDVQFSTPYLVSEQVIVVTPESGITSIDGLKGKKVGAGLGTTGEQAAMDAIEDVQMSSPGDYTIMFEALKNGVLDAVVCDGLVAQNYAQSNNLVVLDEPLINEENSIIVENKNAELLKAVNAAVEKFKASDKYTELQKKWGIIL